MTLSLFCVLLLLLRPQSGLPFWFAGEPGRRFHPRSVKIYLAGFFTLDKMPLVIGIMLLILTFCISEQFTEGISCNQ